MCIVVPKDTLNTHGNGLNRPDYYSNFSLLFRNYVPWRDTQYKFLPDRWSEFVRFRFDEASLTNLHKRGDSILNKFHELGIPTYQFSMRTSWRLITGIGASSSLEVGMILHHIYGIPYIPSSSIKGLLRYYLKKVKPTSDLDVNVLLGYSNGDNAAKGKIVFLDAFPEPGFQISVDIMNNHYQDYYMGDLPPADWMDPNPIKFLTVRDASFVFRMFADKTDVDKSTLEKVAQALSQALTELGIGAKTAVGYGRLRGGQKVEPALPQEPISPEKSESESHIKEELYFYADPDGTKEYYLQRLNMVEPHSQKVEWLFQKWENDEQWKNDKEIAQAFLPKIKKQKKSGKDTHFYKVIRGLLGENL